MLNRDVDPLIFSDRTNEARSNVVKESKEMKKNGSDNSKRMIEGER